MVKAIIQPELHRLNPWRIAKFGRSSSQRLGFPLRIIGFSFAPVVPQQVGSWKMELVTSQTKLPARSRIRLETVIASGVNPKAVVLFHEIPTQSTSQASGQFVKAVRSRVSSGVIWTQQECPVLLERATQTLVTGLEKTEVSSRKYVPVVGNFLVKSAAVAVPVLATVAVGLLFAAASIATALLHDPCLVVVTQDGFWIEVDRWDE